MHYRHVIYAMERDWKGEIVTTDFPSGFNAFVLYFFYLLNDKIKLFFFYLLVYK